MGGDVLEGNRLKYNSTAPSKSKQSTSVLAQAVSAQNVVGNKNDTMRILWREMLPKNSPNAHLRARVTVIRLEEAVD